MDLVCPESKRPAVRQSGTKSCCSDSMVLEVVALVVNACARRLGLARSIAWGGLKGAHCMGRSQGSFKGVPGEEGVRDPAMCTFFRAFGRRPDFGLLVKGRLAAAS